MKRNTTHVYGVKNKELLGFHATMIKHKFMHFEWIKALWGPFSSKHCSQQVL